MKRSLLVIFFLFCAVFIYAQDRCDTVRVYFRQGFATVDPAFRNNDAELAGLDSLMKSVHQDSTYAIRSIRIISYASPEGKYHTNQRLSERRAATMRKQIQEFFLRYGLELSDDSFVVESRGINWEGLIELVAASEIMPHREEMLDILRYTPEIQVHSGRNVYARKLAMEHLHGGLPYRWMYEHFFPKLRVSSMVIVRKQPVLATLEGSVLTSDKAVASQVEELVVCLPERSEVVEAPKLQAAKDPFVAFKTNLLYDAALVPNIGVELYLGQNWSVSANWMYAWWKSDPLNWYWRTYGGEVAVRKWFGENSKLRPLTGHHVGLYGQMLTYDFEWGGRGYLGDRWTWAGGLEYGYAIPLSDCLNLDFVIGFGYMTGEFYEYLPIDDCYVWQATLNRRYIGPTKAEVSLTWVIGKQAYRKGGRR